MTDTSSPPHPAKTVSQVSSIFTAIAGAFILVSCYTPAFVLSGSENGTYTLAGVADGPFFLLAGVIIVGLGIGRYLTDHKAFQIFAILAGLGVIQLSYADSQSLSQRFNDLMAQNLYTYVRFTPGPALGLVGFAGIVVIVTGAIAPHKPKLEVPKPAPAVERPAPVVAKRADILASNVIVWLFVLCGVVLVAFLVWAVFGI